MPVTGLLLREDTTGNHSDKVFGTDAIEDIAPLLIVYVECPPIIAHWHVAYLNSFHPMEGRVDLINHDGIPSLGVSDELEIRVVRHLI